MSVLFCTPCYGGMMHAAHMRSCSNLKETLTELGLKHDWLIGTNESLVHRGRMEMTATFLETDYQFMMWLDSDIEFTPDDVAKLWNMAASGHEVCVGVYPMKKPGKSWFAAWVNGELIKDLDQFKEPIAVDYAGTGFMLISRQAIKLVIKHKQLKHDIAKALSNHVKAPTPLHKSVLGEMVDAMAAEFEGAEGKRIPALYMTPVYQDILESEDYHWCRAVRECGMKVMMDPSVRLAHWGTWAYGQFERLAWDATAEGVSN